jgi:hypothetical protein
MIVREAGSMLGGHSASRKFGGPDIYAVARRAFMAGELDGNRKENMRAVVDALCGLVATLCAFNFWTTEHCYYMVRQDTPGRFFPSRFHL